MQSRVARVMLVALLFAAAAGAGFYLNQLYGQTRQLADDHSRLLSDLARFDARLADLAAAQSAYVAPGQPDLPWIERTAALSTGLNTSLDALRARVRSADSAPAIQSAAESLARLAATDASAREQLAQEQDLFAADIVFGESRDAINGAREAARQVTSTETAAFQADSAAIQRQMLWVGGGIVGLWAIGLLVLMIRPRISPQPNVEADGTLADITRVARPAAAEPIAVRASVDLATAAELCTAISRVVASSALPDMLARMAAIIDASGVIVWLGHRDDLHAAMSHGYNPRVIQQLGSISRSADNATAEAWRTGELRTVAGDMMSNGAIVAPMFGPDSCVGVLAAEVRHGREQDADTQAVTMMIAAQLATVIGAWPSAPEARAAEA